MLGRYLLLRKIARGGMGEVFLASTTGIEGAERPVVVKIIRREHAKDPSFIARFLDEARVQAQLQHSGVAQVLDATIDEATGEPYAVVEYIEGKSLGDLRAGALQIGHAIRWTDAAAIATLIAEALAHVHDRRDASGRALSIVHRDLSPQNVMVSYAGDAKIIDFGTARGQNRRCHTVAGVVFAKPGYVAPEVANGDSGDFRVDLYALGVMLWELCAGRRFLQGDANVHLAQVARNAKNLPPIAASLGAPAELDAILAKLTAFDREARYLETRKAANDLAKLLASAPALSGGERSVRARTAELMRAIFRGEQARGRAEFERLVESAKATVGEPSKPRAESKPEPADRLPGTRYKLVGVIGRGALSVVHEAEHLDLGRRFAVKVLTAGQGRAAADRLKREARILSTLSHEGLTAVHDVGETTDGRVYCVMELLEGETLEAFLAREKGMDYREALTLVKGALSALATVHRAGYIHRDIKPANIYLAAGAGAPFGGVKVLDLGLAQGPGDEVLTGGRAGAALFGTPEYMAPEQAARGEIDGRADLYAIGCVLYEMLTGTLPFAGDSAHAILDAKAKGSPERPRDRAPARGIPEAVDELLMRALARHPSERFMSAESMARAVDEALAAPVKKRGARRAIGLAMTAAALAVSAALLVGKAKQIRASIPWLKPNVAKVAAVSAPPPPAMPAAPTPPVAPAPADDPAVLADELGEDPALAALPNEPPAEPVALVPEPDAPKAEPPKADPPKKVAGNARRKAKKQASPSAPKLEGADKPLDAALDLAEEVIAKGKRRILRHDKPAKRHKARYANKAP